MSERERREEWLADALQRLGERIEDPKAIQRTTSGGENGTRKGYDTAGYGYQWIVDRLNSVLGLGGWRATASYEVETYKTRSEKTMYAVVAMVRIELGETNDDGVWIPLALRECAGGHDSLTLCDAKKGAFTNGLKKTAALFGCGAQVYRDELDDDNRPRPEGPGDRATPKKVDAHEARKSAEKPKPKRDEKAPEKTPEQRMKFAAGQLGQLAMTHGNEACALATEGMVRVKTPECMEALVKAIVKKHGWHPTSGIDPAKVKSPAEIAKEIAVNLEIERALKNAEPKPPGRGGDYTVRDISNLSAKVGWSTMDLTKYLKSYDAETPFDLDQDKLNLVGEHLFMLSGLPNNDVTY